MSPLCVKPEHLQMKTAGGVQKVGRAVSMQGAAREGEDVHQLAHWP